MSQESKGITADETTRPADAESSADETVETTEQGSGVNSEQVADYLRRHPDFLAERPDLLKVVTPPARWTGESVVDMQRFMVDTLRGEIDGLRNTAQEVIETSRSNMAYQTRTHDAVLGLLAADDLPALVEMVTDELPVLLDVDMAVLGFEPNGSLEMACADVVQLAAGDVDRLIGAGREVRLVAQMSDDGTVFAAGAGLVRSAAFARLHPDGGRPAGLLALGVRREGTFHPGQGTELLRFLARVVDACLRRLLQA